MAELLNYTFDSDSAGDWPYWSSELTGYGGSTRSVGLGRGHLGVPEGVINYGAGRTQVLLGAVGLHVNGTLTADLYLPNVVYELLSTLLMRDNGTLKRNCYGVGNVLNSSSWYVWRWDDVAQANGEGFRTQLAVFTKPAPQNKGWRIKMEAIGSGLKVRVWDVTATEPSVWDYETVTVPGWVPPPGGVRCSILSGATGVPVGGVAHSWDNITFNDTAAGALPVPGNWVATKVTGAAQISCSWSAVTGAATYNVEIQRWTGSAWVAHATLTGLTGTSVTLTSTVGSIASATTYRVRCTPAA